MIFKMIMIMTHHYHHYDDHDDDQNDHNYDNDRSSSSCDMDDHLLRVEYHAGIGISRAVIAAY